MRLKFAAVSAAGLLLLCYFFAGLLGIQAHTDPGEMDTTAYLSAACQIRDTGGIAHHIQNCLTGVYREATQHPAYLLILSPLAERSVHFFVNAKIISFVIGFLFLPVFFFCVRGLFGTAPALLALALVVSAATFLNLSTMVACECLLALFFILFWYCAARGFADGRFWPAAGFFAGAAFLTKSLAIFTLPVFFLSALAHFGGKKIIRNRFFWAFFAVFFLTASPLLARNVKVFGKPLYSDSSAVLWLDRWHDYNRTDIKTHPPTLASYLRTHTPAKIAQIFFKGLFGRDPRMVADGLKPFPFWEHPVDLAKLQGFYETAVSWQGLWASLLFILCLAGLWRSRKNPAALLASLSLALFLVFVGWYSKIFPGQPPTRLLYPVLFFIFIFSSVFIAGIAGRARISAAALLFSVIYLGCLWANFNWSTLNLRKSYSFTNPFVAELLWVDKNLNEGEKLMAGTVFMSYIFYFETKIKGEVIEWPQVDSFEELEQYAKTQSVRYGILDLAAVVYDLKVYRPYFDVGPKIGLRVVADFPPSFSQIYTDPNRPPLYRIYEFHADR